MRIGNSAFLAILLLTFHQTYIGLSGWPIKSRVKRIVGGRNALVGEFPYQISLQVNDTDKHFCGGSILDEYHVLTAAHCVYDYLQAQLRVVAGVLNVTDTSEPTRMNLTVAQVYVHENYDNETLFNDIALLRVDGRFPVNSSVIRPILLQEKHLSPPVICTVSGWGSTRVYSKKNRGILQALDVPIIAQDTCMNSYSTHIKPGMFCAGYMSGGRDSCQRDSGGPLQCGNLLTGIVSWGKECALPKYPGVYIEVSYYKDWISETINKTCKDCGLQKEEKEWVGPVLVSMLL